MAKGNLFQGMARGKVGDVVFSRLDGQQISRVRNRKPANPKTPAQMYQRAIMATVLRAYAAGRDIFDHSFEGKKVGIGNQREFMSRNAVALRQALIYDLEVQPTSHIDVVLNAPKTTYPVPNTYIVSQGTLEGGLFSIQDANANTTSAIIKTPSAQSGETLAAYAQRIGLRVGDIYTFVGFTANKSKTVYSVPNGIGAGAYQEQGSFFFCRLIVTEGINSETPADEALLSSIFEVDETQNIENPIGLESVVAGASIVAQSMFEFINDGEVAATIGVIRSAVDSPLRSTETMHWVSWNNVLGLDWQNVLGAWIREIDTLGGSDLILEGAREKQLKEQAEFITELTSVGNFLAVKDSYNNYAILTRQENAILTSGEGVAIFTKTSDLGTAYIAETGTYNGALRQIKTSLKMENAEAAPNDSANGYVVFDVEGTLFRTKEKVTISGKKETATIVPLSSFQRV